MKRERSVCERDNKKCQKLMRNSEVNKKNLFSHNLGNFGQNAHKLLTLVGGEPLLSELLQILQYNVLSSAL